MDTFSLLKFWKSNPNKVSVDADADSETFADSTFSDPLTEFTDDDDDSFFELELTLPKYAENSVKSEPKISSKPQSPISILRSASPKLGILMFGKFNKKVKKDEEFSDAESFSSNISPKSTNTSLFTVKFRIEDGSIVPKLTRTNSSPKLRKPSSNDESNGSSKRFPNVVVQNIMSFVKPKSPRKDKDGGERFPASSPTRSFPSPRKEKESSRFMTIAKVKQLGKSKSASAMIGVSSPASFPARSDHPGDGIEGAILHCKRSLNTSSKGLSSLSRCSSDPSHDKSIQVSE